jgi:hypothetical protein
MKRCPTCQKEFADSMRFCQTDGTPLVDAAAVGGISPIDDPFKTIVGQPPSMDDPFKTVVGGTGAADQSKDSDILQLPDDEPLDPMKTMVVSPGDLRKDAPQTSASSSTANEPPMPEPPRFKEPDLNPPAFGDLSPQKPTSTGDIFGSGSSSASFPPTPPPFVPPSEPKISDSPFGQPPTNSPFEQQKSSFEPPSPFDAPKPPPPFKEPESPFGSQQTPVDQSPFSQPQTPLGQAGSSGSDPFGDPFSNPTPQAEWNPPPAPMQNWQDQNLGSNTPFQPPAAGSGQNQTLAIVSLVTGILSLICCGSYLFSIIAVVTGFMAKGKAESDPNNFGGRGMAMAGLIMGVVGLVASLLVTVLWILGAFAGRY